MENKTQEFIKKARQKHGELYDYSKTNYVNARQKIIICCKKHGEFLQLPSNHLKGQGCKKCGLISMVNKLSKTTDSYINEAKQIHGNLYDYSKTIFKGNLNSVIIICKIHGEFEQNALSHLQGNGCQYCNGKIFDNKSFLLKANSIHKNFYDYSKTVYKSYYSRLTITCPIHGDFEQTPQVHLRGSGCQECGKIKHNNNLLSNTEDFILKASQIHNNKYSYHKVNYIDAKTPVWIHCSETDEDGHSHGDFEQTPQAHLRGKGCSICSKKISKPELKLQEFLENFEIQTNVKTIINGELDIFIPEKNIAIEYNGLYWHSEINRPDNKYHLKKTESCESKGIQLIHVFEDEWVSKQDIVKSRIKNILGITDYRIYARKCSIREVETAEARKFLEDNHIQGFVGGKYYYGLYYQNKLVSIMTFGYLRRNLGQKTIQDNEYELLRFCNILNTSVIGAASKLFKHFLKIHNPKRIISYADRRWSIGKLYETLGFKFSHNSSPNYFYVIGRERKNRYNFRKDILIKEYGCSVADTEHNFCFNKGWYRIYDSGAKVYEFDNC
jgi:hypothetical protein